MMLVDQIPLSDGVIKLATINLNEAAELHEMLSNKRLCDLAGLIPHTHIHQTLDFIIEGNIGVKNYQQYFYGIYVDNRLIGLINLFNLDYVNKEAEYGYFIHENEARKGYMSRSIKLLSNYVLEQTAIIKINVYVDTSNKASLALANKLAMDPGPVTVETDMQERSIDMMKFTISKIMD